MRNAMPIIFSVLCLAHVLVFTKHSAKHFRDTKHHDANNCYNIPMFRLLSHNFLTTIRIIGWARSRGSPASRKSALSHLEPRSSRGPLQAAPRSHHTQVRKHNPNKSPHGVAASLQISTLNHSTSWRHLRLVLASLTISDNLWVSDIWSLIWPCQCCLNSCQNIKSTLSQNIVCVLIFSLRPHSKLANGQPFPSIFVVTATTHTKRAAHPFWKWLESSSFTLPPVKINSSARWDVASLAAPTCLKSGYIWAIHWLYPLDNWLSQVSRPNRPALGSPRVGRSSQATWWSRPGRCV